jgi:hypothetical protein
LNLVNGNEIFTETLRNRHNDEISNLYKEMELTRNIRLRKLQWVGHVMRKKNETVAKKALKE